jgi:hypothetical protein
MLGSKVKVVRERHPRTLSAQRIHDADRILTARKQILVEPHSRGMRADPLEQARRDQLLAGSPPDNQDQPKGDG